MISIKNLSHKYISKKNIAQVPALSTLNLSIKRGDFCVAIGPNGSGKSTLFQILSGMFRPSEGSAEINGFACATTEARHSIGIVFQNPALDKILTVRENLSFFGNLHGLTGSALSSRIDAVTAWTHIADRLDTPAGQLSGGQQRQAELAKCLIPAPPVLLLDEPTTGLDPVGRQAFQDTIATLQKETDLTVLMTTHVFSEAEHADQVAILDKGLLIAEGTPRSLCETLGTEVISIQCKNTDSAATEALATSLHADGFLSAHATSLDVRIDDLSRGDAIPLVTKIMEQHGPNIASIAIKQPTLDDVFVSLTSGSAS